MDTHLLKLTLRNTLVYPSINTHLGPHTSMPQPRRPMELEPSSNATNARRTCESLIRPILEYSDRLRPDEPPFTNVGVDYFGPIEVKKGRSIIKRYGVIFTCMSTRAVHLEVAFSFDTDSCINALRRFISRRAPVKLFVSDNGTNLVAAERELREEIKQWNKNTIMTTLQQQGIRWQFNPPADSHFGGVWERLIHSIGRYNVLADDIL